jgi:hypothetical protein
VIELYHFSSDTQDLYYTSSTIAVTFGGNVYTPISISRGDDLQTRDLNKSTMSLDTTLAIALPYVKDRHEYVTSVTIYQEDSGSYSAIWKGRVVKASLSDGRGKIDCEKVFTKFKFYGLRERQMRQCRFALYKRGCNLNPDDFAIAGTVSDITGNTVTVSAASGYDDGEFIGGMIKPPSGIYRYIANHVGSVLTLMEPIDGLSVSDAVTIYPGCDRSRSRCNTRFDNLDNNGGFYWIPTKNVLTGTSSIL